MINLSADEWEFKVTNINSKNHINSQMEYPDGRGWILVEWKINQENAHRFLWARKREGQPYR